MVLNSLGPYQSCWREIQRRFLFCFLCWLLIFLLSFYFRRELMWLLRYPLKLSFSSIPPLVSLSVIDGIYVSFELSFYASFLICLPVFAIHIWRFLMPALHTKERLLLRFVFVFGGCLFFMGLCVAWYVVLPMLFQYGQLLFPEDVMWLIDFRNYLALFWSVGVYVGLVFQLPILIFLLSYFDLVNSQLLQGCRQYVFLACFVFGMLVTPPDMFLQILFALPMYALFELGWFLSFVARWMVSRQTLLLENHQ